MKTKLHLTDKEKSLLRALEQAISAEKNITGKSEVDSNVIKHFTILKPRTLGGVVGSLIKKELVAVRYRLGWGEPNLISLTETGKKLAKRRA